MKLGIFNSLFQNKVKTLPPKHRILTLEEQIFKNSINLELLIGSVQNQCKVRGCIRKAEEYFCKYHKIIATSGTIIYCIKCKEIVSIESYRYEEKIINYKSDCLLCRSWQCSS